MKYERLCGSKMTICMLDLPDDLLRCLVHEWLKDNGACFASLDIACCNHNVRPAVLRALEGITLEMDDDVIQNEELHLMLRWMIQRKMSFSNLHFRNESFSKLNDALFKAAKGREFCGLLDRVSTVDMQGLAASRAPSVKKLLAHAGLTNVEHFLMNHSFHGVAAPWLALSNPLNVKVLTTPASVVSLEVHVRKLVNLRELTLHECKLANATVIAILSHLPSLEILELYYSIRPLAPGRGMANVLPPESTWQPRPLITELTMHFDLDAELSLLLYLLHCCTNLKLLSLNAQDMEINEGQSRALDQALVRTLRSLTSLDMQELNLHPSPPSIGTALATIMDDDMLHDYPLEDMSIRKCMVSQCNLLFHALTRCHQLDDVKLDSGQEHDAGSVQAALGLLSALDVSTVSDFTFRCPINTEPVRQVWTDGALLPLLQRLPKVEFLRIMNTPCRLLDDPSSPLPAFPCLKHLQFDGLQLRPFGVHPLTQPAQTFVSSYFSTLECLILSNMRLTDAQFVTILKQYSNTPWFEQIEVQHVLELTLTQITQSVWRETMLTKPRTTKKPLAMVFIDVPKLSLTALEKALKICGDKMEVGVCDLPEADRQFRDQLHRLHAKYQSRFDIVEVDWSQSQIQVLTGMVDGSGRR